MLIKTLVAWLTVCKSIFLLHNFRPNASHSLNLLARGNPTAALGGAFL